jgi:hypothetical protein
MKLMMCTRNMYGVPDMYYQENSSNKSWQSKKYISPNVNNPLVTERSRQILKLMYGISFVSHMRTFMIIPPMGAKMQSKKNTGIHVKYH